MTPIMWIFLIVFFVIIEAMTKGLYTIWFAIGGVAGFAASLLEVDVLPQWFIFAGVSALFLFITRPLAKKMMKQEDPMKTNVDALIGRRALITKTVNNRLNKGEAVLDGKYWSVVSEDDEIINAGETVTVNEIKGVRLVVQRDRQS